MLMTKIDTAKEIGQTFCPNWSYRSGQLVQNAKWTSPLDSTHQVDQDSYVERPIWSPDVRDMASGRSAPRPVRPVHRGGQIGFGQ